MFMQGILQHACCAIVSGGLNTSSSLFHTLWLLCVFFGSTISHMRGVANKWKDIILCNRMTS